MAALALALGVAAASPAPGQVTPASVAPGEDGQAALISADEIIHDRDSEVVTAWGNVEIVQGGVLGGELAHEPGNVDAALDAPAHV